MALKIADMAKLFDEKHSLIDYLPWGDCVDGFFVQVDGSIGKIWELRPIEAEMASRGQLEDITTVFSSFVGRLSSDLHCQLILLCDSEVEGILGYYQKSAQDNDNRIVTAVIDEKIKHIYASKDGFFKDSRENFYPRRVRVLFTVRYFPEWAKPTTKQQFNFLFSAPLSVRERLNAEWTTHKRFLSKACDYIETSLNGVGMPIKAIDEKELIQVLYRLLNPKRSKEIPQVRVTDNFIREQVLFNAPEARGDGFVLDGYHTRVVSVKELPLHTMTGMFSTETGFGDRFCLLDLLKDFMFTINFVVPNQNDAIDRLKRQKMFAFMQRVSSSGDTSEEAVEKKEELSAVIAETFKGGQSIVYARVHFVLKSESEEEVEQASMSLVNFLNRLNADGLKEEIISPSLFLSCLPLNFHYYYENFVRRTKRVLSGNFVDLLPLYGSFKGTKTPAQTYLNRRGEPIFLDFFDSSTNPHGIIVGASGAGKSFFTNDFIYQNYRLGAHFFVLDKGNSYRKTCNVLGGKYVSFDMANPLTINPFACEMTDENLAFLIDMLAVMASGSDERDRLQREDKSLLQIAIQEAILKVNDEGRKEMILSDVVNVLASESFNASARVDGKRGARLALKLALFTKNGQYGKFFDGPNQFNIGSRFTVFELANLSSHPDLQLVVLLNIMFFITTFVSKEDMLPKRKFLLIDEAWQLLKVSNTAEFIANAFKTFRKYRCSTVAITQEVTDLVQQKSGQAIIANTANKLFLKQESGVIDQIAEQLSLSPQHISALKSIKTVKGRYSEALFISSETSGVLRLVPNPFLYWVANTESRDNEYLSEIQKEKGGDLLEALNFCAKERPYGIR